MKFETGNTGGGFIKANFMRFDYGTFFKTTL